MLSCLELSHFGHRLCLKLRFFWRSILHRISGPKVCHRNPACLIRDRIDKLNPAWLTEFDSKRSTRVCPTDQLSRIGWAASYARFRRDPELFFWLLIGRLCGVRLFAC